MAMVDVMPPAARSRMPRPHRNRAAHTRLVPIDSWETWEFSAPFARRMDLDDMVELPAADQECRPAADQECALPMHPAQAPSAPAFHKAPIRPFLEADQLAQAPPAPSFLDSDGMPVDQGGLRVMHTLPTNERQPVVSSDWVSVDHVCKRREWLVKASDSSGGTSYVGLTEACSFDNGGRTFAVDLHGNFLQGFYPIDLVDRTTAEELRCAPWCKREGAFMLPNDTTLRVIVDLDAQVMTVEEVPKKGSAKNRLTFQIDGQGPWRSARLMVSLKQPGDTVVMYV